MATYDKAIESYKKAVTTAASLAASAMLVRGVVNELMPYEVRDLLFSGLGYLRSRMSSQHTVIIEETEGWATNQLYDAARTYLATRINTDMQRLRVSRVDEGNSLMFSMEEGEEMVDVHEGTEFKWHLVCRDNFSAGSSNGNGRGSNGNFRAEVRSFEMSFHRRHKEKALNSYLPHILLYGPPGTGKSSLIAAMANYLKFDVYDLELTEVNWNSSLRRLLIGMTNRSILVIEDIDCTVDLQQREEGQDGSKPNISDDKVTLSGLLNFVDGLWSTSGEERIMVFTTNYKERLDPALLRPGRMDMHIHMGYCCPESFRILASNYHSIDNHATYPEIEELIKEVMVTPAEVAEVLMRNDDTDVALDGLIQFLREKKDAKESRGGHVAHVTKEDEKETTTKTDVSDNQNLDDAGKQ